MSEQQEREALRRIAALAASILATPAATLHVIETAMSIEAEASAALDASPKGEANARLIAAAPELLDALEALMEVAVWDDDFTDKDEFDPVMDRARAVVEKARGQA